MYVLLLVGGFERDFVHGLAQVGCILHGVGESLLIDAQEGVWIHGLEFALGGFCHVDFFRLLEVAPLCLAVIPCDE